MHQQDDCIFCKVARGDAPSWKVMESEHAYAFLDINPINEYHTLVIPKAHHVNVLDAPTETLTQVMSLLKDVVDLYQDKLGLQHMQVISSAGKYGQQDVFHLHFHIVPRHQGDGQSIRWKSHPEWRSRFDGLLEVLK